MKDLWIITAGLNTDYGVFDLDQRLDQISQSVQSVSSRFPDSDIWLISSSSDPLPKNSLAELEDQVQLLAQLELDPRYVRPPQLDPNQFWAKTWGELTIWSYALKLLFKERSKYRRIHKLSGRYQITDHYLSHDFDSDHLIFGRSLAWSDRNSNSHRRVYPTRVWSFPAARLDDLILAWRNIHMETDHEVRNKGQISVIEYQLYKKIQQLELPVIETAPLGVRGFFGQDAAWIEE
jgi:hypothetical protein